MYAGCQTVLIWSIAALIAATSVGALTACACTFLASEVESSAYRRVVMPRARSALISAVTACRIFGPARTPVLGARSLLVDHQDLDHRHARHRLGSSICALPRL